MHTHTRAKPYACAECGKAKSDKIDAQKIAEFLSKNYSNYKPIAKSKNQEELQALVNRKNDLVKFLVAEKTRLKQPSHELSISGIKKHIKYLEKRLKY